MSGFLMQFCINQLHFPNFSIVMPCISIWGISIFYLFKLFFVELCS